MTCERLYFPAERWLSLTRIAYITNLFRSSLVLPGLPSATGKELSLARPSGQVTWNLSDDVGNLWTQHRLHFPGGLDQPPRCAVQFWAAGCVPCTVSFGDDVIPNLLQIAGDLNWIFWILMLMKSHFLYWCGVFDAPETKQKISKDPAPQHHAQWGQVRSVTECSSPAPWWCWSQATTSEGPPLQRHEWCQSGWLKPLVPPRGVVVQCALDMPGSATWRAMLCNGGMVVWEGRVWHGATGALSFKNNI